MDGALWKPVAGTASANPAGGGPVVMWQWKRSVPMARTMKEVCLCLYTGILQIDGSVFKQVYVFYRLRKLA